MSEKMKDLFDAEASFTLASELKRLIRMDNEIKAAELELKKHKHEKESFEEKLHLRMESEGVQNVNLDGVTCLRRVDVYFSVKKEEKEKAHDWLKAEGYGDLFKMSINARTLTGTLKERLEDGGEVDETLINKVTRNRVAIRRS